MALDEIKITEAILESYLSILKSNLKVDVAIVGGGPAGLMAGYRLASMGHKVVLFERKLSLGGGMWGGGMMFNRIVVQEEAKVILDELGVSTEHFREGYLTADAPETVGALVYRSRKAGLSIYNLMSVEDVVLRENRVIGLVINWTAVDMAGLHVDPLTMHAKFVVDATGHATEIMHILERKSGISLYTETGKVIGEKSLWAEVAETTTLENTKEAFPGVYVAGMAANATFGSFRMGPIFGGMLLSGQKVAELIHKRLTS